jgi:hypothetical protein
MARPAVLVTAPVRLVAGAVAPAGVRVVARAGAAPRAVVAAVRGVGVRAAGVRAAGVRGVAVLAAFGVAGVRGVGAGRGVLAVRLVADFKAPAARAVAARAVPAAAPAARAVAAPAAPAARAVAAPAARAARAEAAPAARVAATTFAAPVAASGVGGLPRSLRAATTPAAVAAAATPAAAATRVPVRAGVVSALSGCSAPLPLAAATVLLVAVPFAAVSLFPPFLSGMTLLSMGWGPARVHAALPPAS